MRKLRKNLIIGFLFLIIISCSNTDSQYIDALKDNDFFSEYAGETQAITLAQKKCESINNGASNSGPNYEKIGIEYYCPEYLETFRVLEIGFPYVGIKIVLAPEPYDFDFPIQGPTSSCSGTGGYRDINENLDITLNDADGKRVAKANHVYSLGNHLDELGDGYVDELFRCELLFEFTNIDEVDTGYYTLILDDRGEAEYTWSEFTRGIEHTFTLGDGFGAACTLDELISKTCFLIDE